MSIFSNRKEVIKEINDTLWKGVLEEPQDIIKCIDSTRYQWQVPKDFSFNTKDFQIDTVVIYIYDNYPNIESQEHMALNYRVWKAMFYIYFKDDKVPRFDSSLRQGYNPDPTLSKEQMLKYITADIKSNFNKIIEAYYKYRENHMMISATNFIESWVKL